MTIFFSCQNENNKFVKNDFIGFKNIWSSPYSVDTIYKHHLVNREVKYLFILNKTAWAYFGCKYPEKVIEKANRQRVNVIRVCLEGTPFDNILNIDLWPWGGTRENPDWITFNKEYWRRVEDRIQLAGENGIGIDLVLYFDLKPEVSDINDQKLYWNQILNRLSKYSNILTWEIMNEETDNEVFQDSAGFFF
jgi:hypothetical protein